MDCFIIRIYRRIAQENGQPDEIAGLVERVGRKDDGRPFSSYMSLINALRDEYSSADTDDRQQTPEEVTGGVRLAHAAKNR